MSQSQIFMENNIYMAMMDIKGDIEKLKANHKQIKDQIKKCHHLCSKTQSKTEQQIQQITKIVTNSFLQLTAHNSLTEKQNKVYEDVLASNKKLVDDTKLENNRLFGIFDKQKQQIERVLKANQLVVNEQLTAICKQQQSKIEQQISEFNRQNQFIEEQKLKIQLAFEAVANFEQRNQDLEKRLLEQKKQIQLFIAEATQKNAELVEKFIYAKADQANGIYQQQIRNIQGIKNQFERTKNECLVNIDEKIRRGDQNMGKQLRYAEQIKSEMNKLKCQCQGYYYQQKRMVDRANQQFKRIEHMKETIRKQQKEYENKFDGMKKDINRIQDQHNSHFEVKWRDIDTKINRCDDKCNNSEKIVNQYSMQINEVKRKVETIEDIRRQIATIKGSQDSSTNKVSSLQNSVRTIEDRLRKVQERSRSHSRHRHKGAQ